MSKKRKNSNYQTEGMKQETERIRQKYKRTKTVMIVSAIVCLVAGVSLVLLALLGGN